MTLLLHSAVPAMAQLRSDAENPDIVLPDPPAKVANPIPPSQINADKAVVSPASSSGPVKTACSDADPCAKPTPASR